MRNINAPLGCEVGHGIVGPVLRTYAAFSGKISLLAFGGIGSTLHYRGLASQPSGTSVDNFSKFR